MNLMLTNACNERCSFCYAEQFFATDREASRADFELIKEHLAQYAKLVHAAQIPDWDADAPELQRTLYSAKAINFLGGEPTLYPHFAELVEFIHGLGLGVLLFTNGAFPEKIHPIRKKLWTITLNGHFAHRAPNLNIDPMRIHANLPIIPGDDLLARLKVIRDAQIKTLYLAFATPAGQRPGHFFTPEDLEEMKRLHQLAVAFCAENGIFLAYDCSFPKCVDAHVAETMCSSVPVMNTQGEISICGGDYYAQKGKRPLSDFATLEDLHAFTFGRITVQRSEPSIFEICNGCEHFNVSCHGMCLKFRKTPETSEST